MAFNPKDLPKIKEALAFLNSEFCTGERKLFKAYHTRETQFPLDDFWHICCHNYLVFDSPDEETAWQFNLCKESIRLKWPELKIVFCFMHSVTLEVTKKRHPKAILMK